MPKIKIIAPKSDLFDDITQISIHGGAPGALMHVTARVRDAQGVRWESEAYFKIPGSKKISLNSDRPAYGTWNTENSENGLFWAMAPQFSKAEKLKARPSALAIDGIKKLKFEIRAASGKQSGKHTLEKILCASNVARRILNEDGLLGELFFPKNEKKKRPLLVFTTGSGGGISGIRPAAQLMASRGYPALALPYFNYRSLPKTLENVPLEYFSKASKWLRRQKGYHHRKVVIIGGSRGGELALLLGLHFPDDFQALVARVPSMYVWGGFNGKPKADPAWFLKGKPLAFVSASGAKRDGIELPSGMAVSSYFMDLLKSEPAPDSLIPVEKIRCPALLLGARDDQMWPSGFFVEEMAKRMRRKSTTAYILDGAGHSCFSSPNNPRYGWAFKHPLDGGAYSFGGTPEGDAKASLMGHRAFLKFLKEVEA